MISRRDFLKISSAGLAALFVSPRTGTLRRVFAQIPGGTLTADLVPKFVTPLLIPPVMPKAGTIKHRTGKKVDYYEISVKQFAQQILPAATAHDHGLGVRRGQVRQPEWTAATPRPSLTIEAQAEVPCVSNGSTIWWMNGGNICPISCRSTQPYTGQIHPEG